MEDAEDKFFNGYLRRNMAKIVTTVKVRELVPHLPSLTQSDRENIEAKRESTGNYNAMQLLLSSLRHKDNWLEEFISALKTCEHSGFASQIQEEYKSLKIQPNVSALAPMAPMSGGTLQPPLDLSTVSTPKMDEAVDVALSLPPEAAPGDGILANHTGPSSVVVSSQSPAEPAASVQTHTTEDIGAVTPTSHISSPAVPSPSPQVPAVEPIQDANPKLQSASDKSADTSKSSVGQVLAQGLHLSPVLGSPTEEVAGVMASLTEQDVTDGLISPSCVGRASAGEEVCSNKPVLLTSIHSVQVHQPFDSPSTFPPIPDQGAYSDDTVNLECSSSLSHHTSESVNTENIALSDAKKVSPGDAENVTLCDARKVDTALEPTDPHLPQNVLKENDCGIAQQEISSPDAPSSNHNSESFFPGEADNGVSGEGDSGAPDGRDSVDQVDSESGGPAEGHSEASCDEDNGDTESEAPGEEDNGASGNVDDGAPGGRDNGASGDKDGGASGDSASPNNMGSQSPGDTTSNKETVENHRSSTHLTINLTSPASLNKKPDSAAYVDMESHIHKPTKNHCSAPCCDITDEQDVDKKKLCMSEDLAPQNHTVSGETAVGVITEKKLEAFPEQGQLNQRSPLGNYYVPAAVVGVVAAAMLWQLKK
ncbi:hypothetical protein ANANG_G00137990 [Anguilla anguilla]|uniref:Mitochondrial antiviral-signaling protein n=1 Tax=Anguilla anguilla TaxID=7936 RepID=A0A9D3MA94_ANGAN|nr:hypothetical protein ANANG_G00137990 [Anguilla anguilla]